MQGEVERALRCRPPSLPNRPLFEPEEDVTRWTVSRFRLLPNRRQ
jgi:hypothetical protein